jgi:hypothetical protein
MAATSAVFIENLHRSCARFPNLAIVPFSQVQAESRKPGAKPASGGTDGTTR